MQDNQLSIASVTGVDIELEIAGPGSRSYAFVVDWHIRIILALAWFVCAMLLVAGTLSLTGIDTDESAMLWLVLVPTGVIYVLYQPIVELLMRGRSPGKRIAGVRIVTVTGETPGAGAILIRNIFRLIDSLPVCYALGLIVTFVTRQHVRIGDMAAGTLLVIDHEQSRKALSKLSTQRNPALDPKVADLIDEILERWPSLDKAKRFQLGAVLLQRADSRYDATRIAGLSDRDLHDRLSSTLKQGAGT